MMVVKLLAGMLLLSGVARAQAPAFEVASIRESKPGSDNGRMLFGDDSCTIRNMPLKPVIANVYGVRMDLISGLPGWAETMRFDIEAKEDEETAARLKKLPNDERYAEQKGMMRALLAERFGLKATRVEKLLPSYDMVVAKGGFKLKDADPNNDYANGVKIQGVGAGKGMMMAGRGMVTAQGVDLKALAAALSQQLQRKVVDKTGLPGKYDYALKWNPDDQNAASELPDFFTAMEEELGLKLVASKAPTDTLTVDAVEKPSGN